MIANEVVITTEIKPAYIPPRADQRFSDLTDDTHFAAQMLAGRRQVAARWRNDPHGIFNRDELHPGWLDINFAPTEGWQNQGGRAGHQMRAVQLGGYLHGQSASCESHAPYTRYREWRS